MALTTTHFLLQGLFLWSVMGKNTRNYYKNHRGQFLAINLFAILPDIDLLIGYHRSITHNIVVPVFFLLVVLAIEVINKRRNEYDEKAKNVLRFMKLAGVMVILHILLDLGWGPLPLFWPLDNSYYDVSFYLRLENRPWLGFALALVGIIPKVSIINPEAGIRTFFVNLSQEERQQLFGRYIDLLLTDFIVEIVLAVMWMTVIFIPTLANTNWKITKKVRQLKTSSSPVLRRFGRHATLLGAFVLLLGLFAGPMIGTVYSFDSSINFRYINTKTEFDPTLGFIVDNLYYKPINLKLESTVNLVKYNLSVIITNNEHFYNFFDEFEKIVLSYYASNITYNELVANYTFLVDTVKGNSLYYEQVQGNDTNIVHIVDFSEIEYRDNYYVLSVIDEWVETESFVYDIKVTVKYQYDRASIYQTALVLCVLGVLLIVFDQMIIQKYLDLKNDKQKTKRVIE